MAGSASEREPIEVLKVPRPGDPRKLVLGEALFNDPILSGKRQLACSTCHDLASGGTVHIARTIGYMGREHRYNAPTVFNVADNYRLGWRGNFTSLQDQTDSILMDPNLMASDWPTLLTKMSRSRFEPVFEAIYGHEPTREDILDIMATYLRSLVTPNSRFDRYLSGDKTALSASEVKGYEVFKTFGCASCHQGSNVGGNLVQKFGLFNIPPSNPDPNYDGDLGRFTITHREEDKGVFRVPSLRNVALTAPYFHDGRAKTLEEAVRTMAECQVGENIDPSDVTLIVGFLKTLTGEFKGKPLDAP
ncbi:cytochrome-c peroxidase [Oryzifoliimicrobium ureilyticus]|uniref:cytochrome-c peroxidase n=1 Tax=Oryzifoliimicrobium ureilyticus TaxID=3113724 RepID=UPI0030764066